MNIKEEFRIYLDCNESREPILEVIEDFRNILDDSEYDKDKYNSWSDYVDEGWGEDYGYRQVFYEILKRFNDDLEIYDDDIDYLYEIFIDWLLN